MSPEIAACPQPRRPRWQPLRLGLVDLYHYDVEEFRFEDGHLLLRGNNGTGKSKVLSLTLPFLLDASLASSRVEPDGDRGKRMEWNLLMGKWPRRLGYAWAEFGRVDDGVPRFLTLGCGMQAVAGRGRLDHWFFLTPQRIGADFTLLSPARSALTREQLAEALEGHGQVFTAARDYRRAVDERLFRLGEQRYGALMDTLIQLRQPQLSKRPDEGLLSDALAESLPPLDENLLSVVAEAMNQLDDYRGELESLQRLGEAVASFGARYRRYAQVQTRRLAAVLRRAQTDFDKASRELNDATAALAAARERSDAAGKRCDTLETQLRADRERLAVFRSDPVMRDAQRLQDAQSAQQRAQTAQEQAEQQRTDSQRRKAEEDDALDIRARQVAAAEARSEQRLTALQGHAIASGLDQDLVRSASEAAAPETLRKHLQDGAARRRRQIGQLRQRLDRRDQALAVHRRLEDQRQDRAAEHERLQTAAREALAEVQAASSRHLHDWRGYLTGLRELVVADPADALAALETWVESMAGAHPLSDWLRPQHAACAQRLLQQRGERQRERQQLDGESDALRQERAALASGADRQPPAPYTRDPDARLDRVGAPFWQLLDFRPELDAPRRAGLEAALEAAGLLDAWVTPEGVLLDPATRDVWLLPRRIGERHLGHHLRAEAAAPQVQRLLESIACSDDDDGTAEAWIAPDGRFRLGLLHGSHTKPQAEYLGHAAREAARARRLADIDQRLASIERQQAGLLDAQAELDARLARLDAEWLAAPADAALRQAHERFAVREQARREAQDRLADIEARVQEAGQRLRQAQRELDADAEDLRLPTQSEALTAVASALPAFELSAAAWVQALCELLSARAEHETQRARTARAAADAEVADAQRRQRREEYEQAAARVAALRESVGAKVEELQARIAATEDAVRRDEDGLKAAQRQLAAAQADIAGGEERQRADQRFLDERIGERQQAIARLQAYAATGLFSEALPQLAPPAVPAWGVEAALNLARAAEQALLDVPAEDADWKRIGDQVSQDYTALGQALSALGQQAQVETSDDGLIVQIIYQNRAERPGPLSRLLDVEIEQRRGILSSKEREVLENHLQSEVAASLQRLMREAEGRVQRINAELERRPTSTGVRYRLDWEPRPQSGAESGHGSDTGAPVGLTEARRRLLRQSHDVWSPEDRRQIGDFLQQRIAAQRAVDASGSLAEHLRAALDYRRWHRFRVKRWQDGDWKALTGPASSGERALGLTMPLFAAASSHYDHRDWPHAPRLVLLDEAFAGTDDAARRDCMGLIAEFDLDFVMTSEREWGCYDTLPGVAICQLLRREGVDAVHVSRWIWNGRQRIAADGPHAA